MPLCPLLCPLLCCRYGAFILQELETCCPIIDKIYNSPASESEWAIR
jgi:hypothetical protein